MTDKAHTGRTGRKLHTKKEDIDKQKELNQQLWSEINPEQLKEELFGHLFEEYLRSTRRGNSQSNVPIKITYALKHFSEYTLESSRLITINQLQKITGLNDVILRRHIMNFVILGMITEHRHSTHLLGTKKEVTYSVLPFTEWNPQWLVDINNHIMVLRAEDNG